MSRRKIRTQVEWKVATQRSSAIGPRSFCTRFAHLAGGLVGEGHGQDAVGGNAAHADQVGDAVGEHPGLAASGAGQHEQRALGRLDGLALLGVQAFENHWACTANCLLGIRRSVPGESPRVIEGWGRLNAAPVTRP